MAVLEQALLEKCLDLLIVGHISLAGRISLHRGRPAQIKKAPSLGWPHEQCTNLKSSTSDIHTYYN